MGSIGKAVGLGALTVLLAAAALAGDVDKKEAMMCRAAENLLLALESGNEGLCESAVDMLGEIRCEKAVIPLMRILRDEECPCARTVAALALCKIGDERGVFAVKRAVTFDPDPTVRLRCAWYYNQFVNPDAYAFVPGIMPADVNLAEK